MEDNLRWKMTFNGRQPLIEDNLQWETNFDEEDLLMEDDLQLRTTFIGGISRLRSATYRRCGHFYFYTI